MDNKNIPPSVGEFAIGERDQLLARVAELEGGLRDLRECLDPDDWMGEISMHAYIDALLLAALKQPSAGVDERAAFEAAAAEIYKGWAVGRDVGDVYRTSSWTGTSYMNAYTDLAWEMWKKARAQLASPAGVPDGWRKMLERLADTVEDLNDTVHNMIDDDMEDPDSEREVCEETSELVASARAMRAAAPSPAPTYSSYTTTPGEAVAGIALRQLKDESRWVEIRDLNAHRFPSILAHEYYPVGTVLRLPAPTVEPAHSDDVSVARATLGFWANDLALHGVGDIESAEQIDALLNGGRDA